METILQTIEIVTGLLIIGLVLLQNGSGVGAIFGGDSSIQHTRRGLEKKLHYATILVSLIFFGTAFAGIILL